MTDKAGEHLPTRITSKTFAIGIFQFTVKNGHGHIDGIYREGLINLLIKLGCSKRYQNANVYMYIFMQDNIIYQVEISHIRDAVSFYMENLQDIDVEHKGIRFMATSEKQKETILRNSPSLFNNAILGHLPNHTTPILQDTKTEMFFPFVNCVVRVTKDSVDVLDYSDLQDVCIWKDHIIKREVYITEDYQQAQFAAFIKNVSTNQDKNDTDKDRETAMKTALGYLIHNHSNPTTARAVIAYDEQLTGRGEPVGGTGKGVYIQACSQLSNTATIDGKKVKSENQFSYQVVTPLTQIIAFDDVKPDFDFLMLNSNLTSGWQIEQKNKPPFRFTQQNNPKTYITSNAILKGEGTTTTRRQFIIEFSPFYSKLIKQGVEPIIRTHKAMFFSDDWDQAEWNRFFTYMFMCGRKYLTEGLQFYSYRSVSQNKLMQYTSDDFSEWIGKAKLSTQEKFNITELFTEFKSQYYGMDSDFKQRTFTNYLKTYALTMDWKLSTTRSNHNTIGIFNPK